VSKGPAAVVGALPVVLAVVGMLALGLLLVTAREPAPEPGAVTEQSA
jgi:hypothetical protein